MLVWAGGGGDDLAKSPHMARIGTSVFTDICGLKDKMCQSFGFVDNRGTPTPMMEKSMLYKMTMNGLVPGVAVNSTFFEEARGAPREEEESSGCASRNTQLPEP